MNVATVTDEAVVVLVRGAFFAGMAGQVAGRCDTMAREGRERIDALSAARNMNCERRAHAI